MPDPFGYVRDWRQTLDQTGWWHSFELPDGTEIEGVNTLPALRNRIAQYPISEDLEGKRVLDIGAWDGWFSFEMERRGAEVVAIDCWDNPRFRQMQAVLGSRVDYRIMDVYDATPDRLGKFDVVLFFGVLYHLKHPLLALERVCALADGMAAVESFVLREEHRPGEQIESRPVMEFYETDELGGQIDNWVGPTLACLMALCRTAGFARVDFLAQLSHGACIACYRHWEPAPEGASAAPALIDVCHGSNYGLNFSSSADDYIACWFTCGAEALSRDDVKPEAGGYGVKPIHLKRISEGKWQANFRLPPGLGPGWHDVRVRTGGSGWSNALPIAVDVPVRPGPLEITGVRSGGHRTVELWVAGLPENADRANTSVFLDWTPVKVAYVERATGDAARQVNVEIPAGFSSEVARVTIRLAGVESNPSRVRVIY